MLSTRFFIPPFEGDPPMSSQGEALRASVLARWLQGIVPVAFTEDEIHGDATRFVVTDEDFGVIPNAGNPAYNPNTAVILLGCFSHLDTWWALRSGTPVPPAVGGVSPYEPGITYTFFRVNYTIEDTTARALMLAVADPGDYV